MALEEVDVRPLTPTLLESVIGPVRTARLEATAEVMRSVLDGHLVMNVNSTANGGGVAELLQTLLANARGLGIDTRWVVVEGTPEFFAITKRIHNHLYGTLGDAGPLGPAEHQRYEENLAANTGEVLDLVGPRDVVLLHDPQTAGLAPRLQEAGIGVVWRCHVGVDHQNEHSELAWDFLRPYIEAVDAFVFSCRHFAPSWVPQDRLFVIPPSIDPFSAKNEPISPADVAHSLHHVGLLAGGSGHAPPTFSRRDGSVGRVSRPVDMLDTGAPPDDVPIVLQASRWDALKDMPGVMVGFADSVGEMGDAHLVLAGPAVDGVADDPEAAAVLDRCLTVWRSLPTPVRQRIHLACVPMTDGDEAAAIVNALQRHATVVTQKSLAEGFGLTVAEAMWKSRSVVGSAVGGIVDQIIPGQTGYLLSDPTDLAAFGEIVARLLADPAEADRLGAGAKEHASEQFLGDRHLEQWAQVVGHLL